MSYAVQRAENAWRYDPVDAAWTVVARNRRVLGSLRAELPAPEAALFAERRCVFCEAEHEKVIDAVEHGSARVVALPSPTPLAFVEHEPPPAAPFLEGGALGAHELLVPLGERWHRRPPSALDDATLEALFLLLARRHADLGRDRRLAAMHVALLPPSLTRLGHLSAAVMATPFGARPAPRPESCPVTADLEHARRQGRVLLEQGALSAYVPFAPRGTVHVRVRVELDPQAPGPLPADLVQGYARAVGSVLRALDAVVPSGAAQLSLTRIPLRPQETRVPPLIGDLEIPLEVDQPLSRAWGVRVSSLPPEDLADTLREALSAA